MATSSKSANTSLAVEDEEDVRNSSLIAGLDEDKILAALEKTLTELDDLQNENGTNSAGALNFVDSEDDSASEGYDDGDSYDDVSSDMSHFDDDDDGKEYELSAMMDSLVAELRVEIQNQVVEDYVNDQEQKVLATDTTADTTNTNTTFPDENSDQNDAYVVPVADYASHTTCTDINSDGKTTTTTSGRQPGQQQQTPAVVSPMCADDNDKDPQQEDLRPQAVPNMETLDPDADYEPLSEVNSQDSDYVPMHDYSPARKAKSNSNKTNSTSNGSTQSDIGEPLTSVQEGHAAAAAAQENTNSMTQTSGGKNRRHRTGNSNSNNTASSQPPQVRRQHRSRKRRMSQLKKQKMEELLREQLEDANSNNKSSVSEDAIHALASSEWWTRMVRTAMFRSK